MKQVSGMFGVRKMMKIWGNNNTEYFPHRMAFHVLAYRDSKVVQAFHNSLKHLEEWIGRFTTNPDIQKEVKEAIKAWNGGKKLILQ